MKCPQCRRDVPAVARVCGYCGTRLDSGAGQTLTTTPVMTAIPARFPRRVLGPAVAALAVCGTVVSVVFMAANNDDGAVTTTADFTAIESVVAPTTTQPTTSQVTSPSTVTSASESVSTLGSETIRGVPLVTADEMAYPRLDLSLPPDQCVATGTFHSSDGTLQETNECTGDMAASTSTVHVRHGWTRDRGQSIESLLDAGTRVDLIVDGVPRAPTAYLDHNADGDPMFITYWVLENMSGTHEIIVVWFLEDHVSIASVVRVSFP